VKKSKGISNFISGLIVFATLCTLLVCLIYPNIPIFIKVKAESKIRDHSFKMEQQGYLTPENRDSLIKKLEQSGCKNVSVSGTNSKVDYGSDIYLYVEYDAVIKELEIKDGLLPKINEVTKRVSIPKETVSKCTS